jgi:hypothetical protein
MGRAKMAGAVANGARKDGSQRNDEVVHGTCGVSALRGV